MTWFRSAPALLFLVTSSAAMAQEIPSLPPKPWEQERDDPRKAAQNAAARSFEEKQPKEAARHLMNALWYRPFDTSVLAELVRASVDDPDRAALWSHLLYQAGADAQGVYQPSRELKALLPADAPFLERLGRARAQALAEIVELQKRLAKEGGARSQADPILFHFLRSLAAQISRSMPAQWPVHGPALNAACAPRPNAYLPVVNALKRLMNDGLGNHRTEQAIRSARCLIGLVSQSNFKDLKGPRPPNLDRFGSLATEALTRARQQLRDSQGEPFSIAFLDDMSDEERQQFTRDHASFANPGVALSPTGKYRIETICGHASLLGAAETIEQHHARLVDFFGQDPFGGRQGVVRLVPEAEGLEAEGAGYWWVGGFQSGDITTLRFSSGSIQGLGRGITHELTHRFDGAIYPGIPAWLAEGKAVFTGSAYGRIAESSFADMHTNFGTMETAMRKGYGGERKLTELIEGTIEDYRDNYTAGYALYVYLKSWEVDGRRVFRDRLQLFMEQAGKGRKSPARWFEACFCDGKQGRPKLLKELAEQFGTFINGFYWLNRQPWTERYAVQLEGEESPLVYDAPTWQFSRNRAEPWFGQGQAARAGELLLEFGRPADALQALVWAFELDEWSVERALRLADLLDSQQMQRAAWALRNDTRLRAHWAAVEPPGPSPMLTSLPRLRTFLDLQQEAARHHSTNGHPLTAASLAAEHDLLADRLGLGHTPDLPTPPPDGVAAPFELPTRYVGHLGWFEDDLTGFEEHRVPNLWYDTGEGNLHVGRPEPREKTGQMDRNAHLRHAYVRGQEWLGPGHYRLKTRVHFTTTYVSGAIVIGHTRRDRNVRLGFTAGDYMYSIGQKEDAAELDSISVSLGGIRDGEAAWSGQVASKGVKFEHPSTWFEVELLVYGPHVMAFVNGEAVGVYHTSDGQPIEGYVGFASSFGAYRVETPTIESLDRQRSAGLIDDRAFGLNLTKDGPVHRADLLNRPVLDIPLARSGTVVVWVPGPTAEDQEWIQTDEERAFESRRRTYIAARAARSAANLLFRHGCSQQLVLAIPSFLGPDDLKVLEAELKTPPEVSCVQLVHHKDTDLTRQEGEPIATEMPMILFVDPVGVLRAMAPFMTGTQQMPSELAYWVNVYRGREKAREP